MNECTIAWLFEFIVLDILALLAFFFSLSKTDFTAGPSVWMTLNGGPRNSVFELPVCKSPSQQPTGTFSHVEPLNLPKANAHSI